jgi:hypothetical protein
MGITLTAFNPIELHEGDIVQMVCYENGDNPLCFRGEIPRQYLADDCKILSIEVKEIFSVEKELKVVRDA